MSLFFSEQAQVKDSIYFGMLARTAKIHMNGNMDSAVYYANKMLIESRNVANPRVKGYAHNIRGVCFIYSGNYDSAIVHFKKSVEHYGDAPVKSVCDVYSNMGICNDYLGNFPGAIQAYLRSLEIAERISDSTAIARACNNLGAVYYLQHDFNKAMSYFKKSLQIREGELDDYGIASCCLNIGSCFSELKKNAESEEMYKRSLKHALIAGDSSLLADIYISTGQLLQKQKKYNAALEHYKKVLPLYTLHKDPRQLSDLYNNLGRIYGFMGDKRKAYLHLLQARSFARSASYLLGEKSACEELVVVSAGMGYIDSTGYYLQQVKSIQDSIYSEQSSKEIASMEEKYESNKKDAEIKLKNMQLEKQQTEADKKSLQQKILLGAFGLSGILAFVFYRNYREKSRANKEIEKQKELISSQKAVLEEKQKEILDSIHYARRLQLAQIPSEKSVQNSLNRLREETGS